MILRGVMLQFSGCHLPARITPIKYQLGETFCATEILFSGVSPKTFYCDTTPRRNAALELKQHALMSLLLTNNLDSRRQRLKMLHQRLTEVELQHEMAQPIPTLRIRTCSHPECGARKPRSLPADVMLIYMGCKYEVPSTASSAEVEA